MFHITLTHPCLRHSPSPSATPFPFRTPENIIKCIVKEYYFPKNKRY